MYRLVEFGIYCNRFSPLSDEVEVLSFVLLPTLFRLRSFKDHTINERS